MIAAQVGVQHICRLTALLKLVVVHWSVFEYSRYRDNWNGKRRTIEDLGSERDGQDSCAASAGVAVRV